MSSDPLYAISVAVLVATVYLVVLRAIDPNEKEPLWALALLLFAGAVCAAVAVAGVDPGFRTLSVLGVAVTAKLAKFVAIGLGIAALEGIGRLRGWSEFNGIVDGVVYGAAAGLGYAVGAVLVRELSSAVGVFDLADAAGPLDTLWTNVVFGLREGIFGAIIGAGFAVALTGGGGPLRLGVPLAALVAAIAVHIGYIELADGNTVSGDGVRPLIALVLPVALIAVLMVQALRRERIAIAEELADEAAGGAVTDEELGLLRSPSRRRAAYLRRVGS